MKKRSLYYTSKAYVSQIDKAEDFNIFKNKSFISRHLIINQATTTQDLKDFEFTFIELNKFDKSLKQSNAIIDKWIYFINNASSLEMIPK